MVKRTPDAEKRLADYILHLENGIKKMADDFFRTECGSEVSTSVGEQNSRRPLKAARSTADLPEVTARSLPLPATASGVNASQKASKVSTGSSGKERQ
jgi:hypothetical protein